jgi:hypothetical protein
MPEFTSNEPSDRLRSLADAGGRAARALPGAQVRALGTRRRRRRMTATVGASLAAVAVVVGGAFAAINQLGVFRVEPAAPIPTTIPDGYPIDRDLPDYGGDGDVQGPGPEIEGDEFTLCGAVVLPGDVVPIDRLGVRSVAPEFQHLRLVQLSEAPDEAEAVIRQGAEAGADCPRDDLGGGTVAEHVVEPTPLGGGGVVVLTRYEMDGLPVLGVEQRHLVRLGAAVLMVYESGEYEPRSDLERGWIDELTDVTRTMADDLRACLEDESCGAP